MELAKIRALLFGWAVWKHGLGTHEYLSPPNLIWRLMAGEVNGGGGFGSIEPRGLVKHKHNPIYHRLNCLINELSNRRKAVIYHEFLKKGTQQEKAKSLNMAYRTYKENLNISIKHILADEYIKNLIESV